MDSVWDAVPGGLAESVTVTVKVEVVADVGLPVMTPPGERLTPAGRDPEVIDHV